MSAWELGYLVAGEWKFERRRYELPDEALSVATMYLGAILCAELEADGVYRVTRYDNGATVASRRVQSEDEVRQGSACGRKRTKPIFSHFRSVDSTPRGLA